MGLLKRSQHTSVPKLDAVDLADYEITYMSTMTSVKEAKELSDEDSGRPEGIIIGVDKTEKEIRVQLI